MKEEIVDIYNASYQNYGAPKITAKLHEKGEKISERTYEQMMKLQQGKNSSNISDVDLFG